MSTVTATATAPLSRGAVTLSLDLCTLILKQLEDSALSPFVRAGKEVLSSHLEMFHWHSH